MKTAKNLLIASGINALFFVWVYTTHVYEITWTIAGVFQELLLIPMLLLAPILVIMSIFLVVKKQDLRISLLSLLISASTTATIAWLFYKDFQNLQ
ncbi:MAG: hypothetical protein ACJAXY_001063 [Nonlabens sp.]|jgi:hypothetical protein|uniref:hypothetical protein n=1 Tax=Nonlabens sp. TaxID=1888209 RepID=UPI0039E579AF